MKLIPVLCFSLFLAGCAEINYFPSFVRRNQVYQGQTIEDLYENMGLPTRVEKYNYGMYGHVFMKENIVNDEGVKILQYCDLRVISRDNYVIDWDWRGNNCQFEVADEADI